jgi:hypothetical protein
MSELCIIIADTLGGLDAVAFESEATIIEGSAIKFTSINTHVAEGFWPESKIDGRAIRTGKDGWMALAMKG